jgi:lycopene cyclase CruA
VDALGAGSPHAAFDLVCPTVGGVLTNLAEGDARDEVDYKVGEILVTTEHIEDGKQHIWEGFPAPEKRFTTYLFYYDEPARLGPAPLRALYERFFTVLPRYKRGDAQIERATYGFIPAYSRLREMPAARDRVLLVGDAAARQSPLTFCGFGSMIRSFLPVAEGARRCLAEDRLDARALAKVWFEPPVLKVMGGLTLMMVPSRLKDVTRADDINNLLDVAFATLADMGEDTYAQFVRDEIGFKQFWTFMRRTSKKRPQIYDEVFAQLSRGEIATWMRRLASLGLKKW